MVPQQGVGAEFLGMRRNAVEVKARQEIIRSKVIRAQWFLKAIFCRPSAAVTAIIGVVEMPLHVGVSEAGISSGIPAHLISTQPNLIGPETAPGLWRDAP